MALGLLFLRFRSTGAISIDLATTLWGPGAPLLQTDEVTAKSDHDTRVRA